MCDKDPKHMFPEGESIYLREAAEELTGPQSSGHVRGGLVHS